MYKEQRFYTESVLYIGANTLQTYRDFPVHEFLFVPLTSITKGFIKGEALRLLRTNSSKTTFVVSQKDFTSHLISGQETSW